MSRANRPKHERRKEHKRWRVRRLALMKELKARPCADCRRTYPHYVMHFDHLPGFVKVSDVSSLHTIASILREAAKCELVCANCHADRTFARHRAAQVRLPGGQRVLFD